MFDILYPRNVSYQFATDITYNVQAFIEVFCPIANTQVLSSVW